MGQKTNPNIFRLGINKTWKTEYFEKKRHELPLYIFKDLEIKDYIKRFLETQGIYLHNYKQHYNNSTLYLYISYFVPIEFIHKETKKIDKSLLILNSEKKISFFNKTRNSFNFFNKTNTNNTIQPILSRFSSKEAYIIRKYLNRSIPSLKKNLPNNSHDLLILDTKGLFVKFFKVLNLFTNKNFEIVIHWSCLNKNFTFLKELKRKNFILFQKFRRTPFLKTGLELMFHVTCNKNSASLLASFIAMHVKKIKRHKFFFAFLKQVLTVLISSNLSEIDGIKIAIKGRLNSAARARHKIIIVGKTPIHSLRTKIDYHQMSVHNSNGSYGIKVWVVEKTKLANTT